MGEAPWAGHSRGTTRGRGTLRLVTLYFEITGRSSLRIHFGILGVYRSSEETHCEENGRRCYLRASGPRAGSGVMATPYGSLPSATLTLTMLVEVSITATFPGSWKLVT